MAVRKAKTIISWQRPLTWSNGLMGNTESSSLSTQPPEKQTWNFSTYLPENKDLATVGSLSRPGIPSFPVAIFYPSLSLPLYDPSPLAFLWSSFSQCGTCQVSFLHIQFSALHSFCFLLLGKDTSETIWMWQIGERYKFASTDFWCWSQSLPGTSLKKSAWKVEPVTSFAGGA